MMQECDLVMKGGITSGVVYPSVLSELSEHYRFRNIGGTSAGAIGAVFAAAAEYRRQTGGGKAGFAEVKKLADDLASNMAKLFQPVPTMRAPFALMMAKLDGKSIALTLAKIFWLQVLFALAIVAAGVFASRHWDNGWIASTAVLLAVMVLGLRAAWLTKVNFLGALPKHDFGLCTGKRQPGHSHPGFTDWIVDGITRISDKEEGYLTVGDLEAEGIDIKVAAITTDLSSGRPYTLPMRTGIHYFRKSEFERLFGKDIVAQMCLGKKALEFEDENGAPDDLYQLPFGPDFPVFLIARMSLSFPGLISAVPLWRFDYQLRKKGQERAPIRRCLFTDGGVSSNFPIHFFDALLPQRPTFGICLEVYDEERHHKTGSDEDRLQMHTKGTSTTNLAVRDIGSLGAFASGIVNVAKDWQDTMQSMLPGYADRIVTIRLSEKEGGMNLNMDKKTIARLDDLGALAGRKLCERFSYKDKKPPLEDKKISTDFDQHRYNRAISLLPALENSLEEFHAALDAVPAGTKNTYSGREVLADFPTVHYKATDKWRKGPFLAMAEGLAVLGASDGTEKLSEFENKPSIDASIRLAAQSDRVPRD